MAKIFISYMRKDQAFVRRLHETLVAQGHDVWADFEDIPLSSKWLAEIYDGIEKSDVILSVLSPEYLVSENCNKEVEHSVKHNKRIVPIVRRDIDFKRVQKDLAEINAIFFRESEDFDTRFKELGDTINLDLDWVKAHTRLLIRAIEWDANRREDSLVLRGRDLHAAEEWLAKATAKVPKPTLLQGEYILASRGSAILRQRIVTGAITFGLIVAMILAALAAFQRNEAVWQQSIAQSRELAASAIAQLQNDPELSILIAREAAHVARTTQAEDALRQALSESHVHAVLKGHAQEETLAAFSSDGKLVATSSFDSASVMGFGETTVWIWDTETGKLLMPLRGHERFVTGVMFSHDGKWVLTSSHDGTARVWSVQTGETSVILQGHQSTVMRAAFSQDDRYIVTAGIDQTIRIWEWETNPRFSSVTIREPSGVNYAEFSPDSTLVVAAMMDGTAQVWQWQSNARTPIATQKHSAGVNIARFDPKGTLVVTASKDKTARVWDAKNGKLVAGLTGYAGSVVDASFDADGKRVVTASEDGTVRVWDLAGKEPVVFVGHIGKVNSAAFSPDGRFVVTAGVDATARLWTIEFREQALVFRGHHSGISSVAFSRDGTYVLTAGTDSTARIWNANAYQAQLELRCTPSSATCAALSPDGKLVAAGAANGQVHVWNVISRTLQSTFVKHTNSISAVAFSPDGKFIVTASQDKTARVWQASTGMEKVVFTKHVQPINSAVFSPDGKFVITASDDRTVRVWDANTGEERFAILQDDQVFNAVFSPNGEFVLTERHFLYRTLSIYQFDAPAQASMPRMITETEGVLNAVFSPNSQLVAAAGFNPGTTGFEGTLLLFDTRSGKNLPALSDFRDLAQGVTFSPDSQLIVTAGNDGTARIWEINTGKLIAILRGHTRAVQRASFSQDGRFVVTASGDGTARVWDARIAKQLIALRDHTGGVTNAFFSSDPRTIITTSTDGKARLFVCEICGSADELLALAERVVRPFTCEERQTYLHENLTCPTPAPTSRP